MTVAEAEKTAIRDKNAGQLPMEPTPLVYDLLPLLEKRDEYLVVMPHNSPFCDPHSPCDQRVTITIPRTNTLNSSSERVVALCDNHCDVHFTETQIRAITAEIVRLQEDANTRGVRIIPYLGAD